MHGATPPAIVIWSALGQPNTHTLLETALLAGPRLFRLARNKHDKACVVWPGLKQISCECFLTSGCADALRFHESRLLTKAIKATCSGSETRQLGQVSGLAGTRTVNSTSSSLHILVHASSSLRPVQPYRVGRIPLCPGHGRGRAHIHIHIHCDFQLVLFSASNPVSAVSTTLTGHTRRSFSSCPLPRPTLPKRSLRFIRENSRVTIILSRL